MKNPYSFSYRYMLTMLAASLVLCAHAQQSSIYLDSRDVADYIRNVQEPYIDASKVRSNGSVKVSRFKGKDTLVFADNKRLPIPEEGIYTLVCKNLEEKDTVFVVGRQRRFITRESADSINLFFKFSADSVYKPEHILYDSTSSSARRGADTIDYGPKDFGFPLRAASKLANHLFFTKGDNQSQQIPLGELQLTYANNPFMARKIMQRPSIAALKRVNLMYWHKFDETFAKAYPWQAVLDGDSTLQLNQQFSFEDQWASYRDQIISSEKALSLASQQINQTSRQGGLFDARTVAVGMSDFIAERAQEELNLTFFERFKTNMLDTNELTILFPKTRDLLVDFEISNYKTLLSHARTSFETDLGNIGLNFPKILSLPKYKELRNDPNVFNLALIYSLADLAYKEYPVEDILLHACQSLDVRNNELRKEAKLRIIDPLWKGQAAITIDRKPDELDTLQQKSVQLLSNFEEAENLMVEAYGRLAKLSDSDRLDVDVPNQSGSGTREKRLIRQGEYRDLFKSRYPEDFYSHFPVRFYYDYIWVTEDGLSTSLDNFYKGRIAAHLSGRKYYEPARFYGYGMSEETFELEFINGKSDPKENYTQGLAYVSQLRSEPMVPALQQRYLELNRYLTDFKAIEQEFFTINMADSDSALLKAYVSRVEKVQSLSKALELENRFWKHFRGNAEHYVTGLEYLWMLFEEKFDIYRDNALLSFHIYISGLLLDGERWELDDFKKSIQSNSGQFEEDFQKYKELLEAQIKRLYQSSENSDWKQLLSMRNIYETESMKVMEYGQIMDSLRIMRFERAKEIKDTTGYSKLYKDIREGRFDSENDSLFDVAETIVHKTDSLVEEDTTIQRLDSLQENVELAYVKADSLLDQKMKALADSWLVNRGGIKDSVSLPVPADYNPYLQQLAHSLAKAKPTEILDEETTQHFKVLDSLMAQIEPAIKRVAEAQRQLAASLDTLENRYCPDLAKAKRNAAHLHTSMEMAMHLLSAFRNPEKPLDSMTINDSLTIAVTVPDASGITHSYDSLVVRQKYISDKNLELPGSRWITLDEFNKLKNDPLQWDIFLGMLYERLRRVEGVPEFSPASLPLLADKFFDIIHAMDVHRGKVRLKKALHEEIGFKDYYPFIKSTVDLFNTVINTPVVGEDRLELAEQFKDIRKVSQISDAALSMYENIYVKNYGNAIRNSMTLLSIFTNSEYDPNNPIYHRSLLERRGGKDSDKEARKLVKAQNAYIRQSRRAINAVLVYGTFMADMIDAQTSEQVKNILKSATLPPGSSRIKREVSSNFTINSYLGGAVAYDQLQENLPGLEKGAIGASLSVPVGFTYSFSPDRIFKRGGSFSIHVPLLDLGAITAFRSNPSADNYQIEQLPEFTWKNLFAPGAFFVWNIRNSPFSLGAGGQIGPQLRQITDVNTMVTTTANSTRFPMVFFSVDVPFFNLHTGAKKIVVD